MSQRSVRLYQEGTADVCELISLATSDMLDGFGKRVSAGGTLTAKELAMVERTSLKGTTGGNKSLALYVLYLVTRAKE